MNFPALIEELNEELNSAVMHGTAERRAEILHRITDVFVAGSANYSDNQIELFDDVFVRLAETIELSARAVLANRLAKISRAPSMISRSLASDDAIDVAGPMLEQSQRLDNNTLVAAARTKSQQHLLAISRRNSLSETITDVLVERGDKPVVLSTANNPTARFSDTGYMTLVQRSEGDDELTTCVGLRRDIPRHHLLRLLVRASHAVRVKLEAANPAMSNTIEEAVAEAASIILDQSDAGARGYDAARAHVESLRAAGELDENDVAVFAKANQIEETMVSLAVLCDLPIQSVERAMNQDRPETVLIMVKAAGMSWPTAKAILRMRAGARGISPGEIEQCQEIFSNLKPATARQVIELHSKRSKGTRFGRRVA
jgi:uncharacterized protein (DUF2336 family)